MEGRASCKVWLSTGRCLTSKTTFSAKAKTDLRKLREYCVSNFGESVADKTVKRIVDRTYRLLDTFPTAGTPRPEFHEDARSFAIPPNTILYKVTKKGAHVRRILHGRQNITAENISFFIAA